MKEKLVFLGTLIMCVLYYIEVIPGGDFNTLNIVGFIVSAIVIVPWLISMFINVKKKREHKEFKKSQKEKDDK